MMITTWERYFFKEIVKNCLFFLVVFFLLYSVIDYAAHAASFHKQNVKFDLGVTLVYYGAALVREFNVLLPFAILIAAIRVLTTLNTHNELIALLSSGISLRTLMRPFLVFGLLCTVLTYLNSQYLETAASQYLNRVDHLRSSKRHKEMEGLGVQHLVLSDGSSLIYHHFDTESQRFMDVYWVENIDSIYHMKSLDPALGGEGIPVGTFVDHFTRNLQGQLLVFQASVERMRLPEIRFNKEVLFEVMVDPDELSLSDLWQKLPLHLETKSEKEAQVVSAFIFKLLMPWLCLLVIVAAAPFCVRFTRNLPVFFIYAGGVLGLVVFDLIMKMTFTLSSRQAFAPEVLLPLVFLGMSLPFAGRFLVMCR